MLSMNGIPNPTGEKQITSGKGGGRGRDRERGEEEERKGDPEKDVCTKQQSILGHVEQGK